MAGLSTTLIHADDKNNRVTDVAPPINVATTYRYDNDNLIKWSEQDDFTFMEAAPVYSREAHPNCTRLESLFSELLDGHAVVYSSGCSAFYAAVVHYNPKQVFMDQCYFGVRAIADILTRNYGTKQYSLAQIEEFAQPGDLVHLESPVNPFGTSIDIEAITKKAHSKGAIVSVDSTFAPPPLQNVWDFGVDLVMHSATKYFGGHSDLLSGVLVVKDKHTSIELKHDRIHLGTIIGNLESYLLLRSLRTYEMRIMKQSDNATKIVQHLNENRHQYSKVLSKLYHSSLETEPFVTKQLKGGHSPVFALCLQSEAQCKKFAGKLKLFQHATSLGGVESLIEWRAMSDDTIDQTLIRVSVGCENSDDLISDLTSALQELQDEA